MIQSKRLLILENDFQQIRSLLINELAILSGKSILITGASGFFGWWIINFISFMNLRYSLDLRVIAISRDIENIKTNLLYPTKKIIYYQFDITNKFCIKEDYDYVLHMAAPTAYETFHGETDESKLKTLEVGTKNLLTQIKSNLKKIIFTSSGVVYGNKVNRAEETCSVNFVKMIGGGLANGKIKAESMIQDFCQQKNIGFSIARCFSFIGPMMPTDLHYAIGNFIEQSIKYNKIVIESDGMARRSYLYISDTIVWLFKILVDSKNDIYNVGSDNEVSISDLATKVKNLIAPSCQIIKLNENIVVEGNFKRNYYVPCVDKIKKDLNVSEYHSLDDSIKKMADFLCC